MCNNCIHKAVCSKFAATGGHVRECEHFREDRKGEWDDVQCVFSCSECKTWLLVEDGNMDMNFCPNCGADMRGEEDGYRLL